MKVIKSINWGHYWLAVIGLILFAELLLIVANHINYNTETSINYTEKALQCKK